MKPVYQKTDKIETKKCAKKHCVKAVLYQIQI